MRNTFLIFLLFPMLSFANSDPELPTAKMIIEEYQASRKSIEQAFTESKNSLKTKLVEALTRHDHAAEKAKDWETRLWTVSLIRRINELEDNWLSVLEDPYPYPESIEALRDHTRNSWEKAQNTAVEDISQNRELLLEKLETLKVQLVHQEKLETALEVRDQRNRMMLSNTDQKLQEKIQKQTPVFYQKRELKIKAEAFEAPTTDQALPPPDAHFPFVAENPTFQEYLKNVKVESGGFFATASSHIQIGQGPVFSGSRGIAMVAYFQGEVLTKDSFDTYAEQTESTRLSQTIGELPYGAFVVIAVRDDATRRFSGSTQSSLYRLGANKGILNLPYRSSYILIGMKGLEMGGAVEMNGLEKMVYAP